MARVARRSAPNNPRSRRQNPDGWTRGKVGTDRYGHLQIEYHRGSRKAKLTFHDVWDPSEIDQAESITTTVEGHHLEESPDQTKFYRNETAALADASKVADLFDERRVTRFPARGEDWEPYLAWFQTQDPNQADYVTLFWTNDPNGAYDSLLLEPLSESKATFEETFPASDYQSNPRDFDLPEEDLEEEEEEYDERQDAAAMARRYYMPEYEIYGEPNPGNPYMGDAVELAKQRKYDEARRQWEREGRRGPPPTPPRSRQRNPREGSLVRRIGGRS